MEDVPHIRSARDGVPLLPAPSVEAAVIEREGSAVAMEDVHGGGESHGGAVAMDDGPSSARRGAQEENPGRGEDAVQLAQGGSEGAGAEEEDTTGPISVYVGNLEDAIDE